MGTLLVNLDVAVSEGGRQRSLVTTARRCRGAMQVAKRWPLCPVLRMTHPADALKWCGGRGRTAPTVLEPRRLAKTWRLG
jgi:hypothetical protein